MGDVRDAMKKTRQPVREAAFQRKSFLRFLGRRANPSDELGRTCMKLYEILKRVHDDTTLVASVKRDRFAVILNEYSQVYMKEQFRGQPRQVLPTNNNAGESSPAITEEIRTLEVPIAGSHELEQFNDGSIRQVADEVPSEGPLVWCELCGSRHTKEFGDEFHDQVILFKGRA